MALRRTKMGKGYKVLYRLFLLMGMKLVYDNGKLCWTPGKRFNGNHPLPVWEQEDYGQILSKYNTIRG
jgi:hypothetical protein